MMPRKIFSCLIALVLIWTPAIGVFSPRSPAKLKGAVNECFQQLRTGDWRQYSPVGDWNFSRVNSVKHIQRYVDQKDVFKWDASRVSSMLKWEVSRVTTMAWMFMAAYSFNSKISKWDMDSVTNMAKMSSIVPQALSGAACTAFRQVFINQQQDPMRCFSCHNVALCSVFATTVLAMIVGVFVSGVPTYLGLFRRRAHWDPLNRYYIGLSPAFMLPEEYRYTFEDVARTDLTGQTAVVTGANSGIGYWASLHLARQGATVIMACRNPHRCDSAAARIRADFPTADVTPMKIDTSKLKTVRRFAVECSQVLGKRPLDMLFLNAGIASAGLDDMGNYLLSEDGMEMVFATNHVGHHFLYNLLEPALQASRMARVVLTSSAAHFHAPDYGVPTDIKTLNHPPKNILNIDMGMNPQYSQSKLAQILFAQELTRRLPAESNIYVNSLHPGAVATGIWGKNPLFPKPAKWILEKLQDGIFWSAEQGSLTMLYLGIATDALEKGNVRGQYFHPQAVRVEPHDIAKDLALQKAVWEFTESLFARSKKSV